MIRQAGYELLRHLRSVRFVGSTLLLALLAALVTWVGISDDRLRRERQEQEKTRHRDELASVTVYSSLRPQLFRPAEPLAVFEGGVMSRIGEQVEISVFEIPFQGAEPSRDNPYLETVTQLDLTAVIQMVLGLEALLLTFDSISKERERGRLDTLLAHGATLPGLVASKGLAAVAALGMSLLIAFLPCPVALARVGQLQRAPGGWHAIVALLVTYLLYGMLMATLGLALSLWSSNSKRALGHALLAWLLLVVLWPQLVFSIGEAWSKRDPASQGIEHRIAEQNQLLDRWIDTRWIEDPIRLGWNGYRTPYHVDTWDFQILRRFGAREFHVSASRHYVEEVRMGRRFAEAKYAIRQAEEEVYRRVARWVDGLAAVSPAHLLEKAAAELAGTTPEIHDDFMGQARQYRQRLIDYFESEGIFGSPRWYSDDPPGGMPWTTFIGLRPEDVTPENAEITRDLFRSEEAQAKNAAEIQRREQEEMLDLEGLPRFVWDREGPFEGARFGRWVRSMGLMGGQLVLLLVLLRSTLRTDRSWERKVRSASSRPRIVSGWWRHALVVTELRQAIRGTRWRWLTALLLVSTVVVARVAHLEYLSAVEHQQSGGSLEYGESGDPVSLSDFVLRLHLLHLPPAPLLFFDDGDRRLPRTYLLSTNPWKISRLGGLIQGNPRLVETPALDLAFIAWVMLPLAAFLMSYDALCGSSLKRLEWLAVSSSRARLLGSLLLARWLALALPLVLGFFAALGLLAVWGGPGWTLEELGKAFVFLLLVLGSIAFFILLALCLSALTGRSSRSLVSLVFLWVIMVALVPAAAEVLARRQQPLADPLTLADAVDKIRIRTNAMRSASDWRSIAWGREDGFAVERRSARIQGIRLHRQRALLSFTLEQQASQALFARQLAQVSPTALFADLGQRWLGSGPYRHRALIEQAEAFRAPFEAAILRQDAMDPESPHVGLFPGYLSLRPINTAVLPRFVFRESTWREGARRGWRQTMILGLLALTLWWVLLAAFERRLRHFGGSPSDW